MSKLLKLIRDLCPDGVPIYTLGEIGKFYGGLTGKSKTDFIDGDASFISYKNVYFNMALDIKPKEKVKIANGEKQNILEYGDIIFTGSSENPNECGLSSVVTEEPTENLYLNSFCFFLRLNDKSIILPHFAKHLFRSKNLRYQIGKTANGVTRFNVSKEKMAKITIPVPPLPVQEEIVRILDSFTSLTAELQAELQARKIQFEQYSMLLFEQVKKKYNTCILSDICSVAKGKTPIQKAIPGNYPMVVTTTERRTSNSYQFDACSVCIPLVSSRGHGVASLNHVYYQTGKFALGNILCAVTPKCSDKVHAKYLYYYFEETKDFTLVPLMKGGANVALRIEDIEKLRIPVPEIEIQKKIVSRLEKFNKLCNKLLPAEIAARQKQYEYYRDKLLTFKELS